MSDDDDDYMSDKFLQACVGGTEKDHTPGLMARSEKRINQQLERKRLHDELNKQKNPSIKIMEFKNREEGLSKPLEETNKGFEMLQKMGYKPGTGIGKRVEGIRDPVPITVKVNRGGLGIEEKGKNKYKKSLRKANEKKVPSPESYRFKLAEKYAEKKLKRDFFNCQRTCQDLDMKKNLVEPDRVWYWPSYAIETSVDANNLNDDEEDDHSEYSNDEENEHSEYSNDEETECQSSETYKQHPTWYEDTEEHEDDYGDEYNNIESDSLTISEKFNELTSYLRRTHYYCFWCGVKGESEFDLESNCPGDNEDAHDL